MRPPRDRVLLLDMLDHARKAMAAVSVRQRRELDYDEILAAALVRFLEVVGEAASRISPETRDTLPDIEWEPIIALRNRLIHGYASVDLDIVWGVATVDLPSLIAALERDIAE
jgi:uncharacterized protein with HEPN domain